MNFKLLGFFTLLLSTLLLTSCKTTGGKHLFILSGQSNMVRLNPNITFLPELEKQFGSENIIIVKDAMGSQSIRRWFKKWESPTGQIPKIRGDLYDTLLIKVKDSIKNKKIKSVTFIWMQGERDARMKFAPVYESSLLGLYNQLQKDLQYNNINFIIGRLNDFDMQNEKWPHWTKIRNIQEKVANSNPSFAWINTDDLNSGLDSNAKMVTNDLHLSEEGYKILSKRFAVKSIELISKN